MFTELSNDDTDEGKDQYQKFYSNFQKNIKLGIHEDAKNRDKLVDLLRFHTSNSPTTLSSLATYVENMKEGQKNIYYITGTSVNSLDHSPFVNGIKKKGYNVLYMVDPIDEYMVQNVTKYKDVELLNISKEGVKIDGDDTNEEDISKKYENFCNKIKKMLDNRVEKVCMSSRLGDEPCCVSSTKYGWSANMERIIKAQTLQNDNIVQQSQFMSKKVFELNPSNIVIKKLHEKYIDNNMDESTMKNMIDLLYETALLASGYIQEDPSHFSKKVYNMISLGIDGGGDEDEEAVDLEEEDSPGEVEEVLPADEVNEASSLEEID